MLNWQVGTRQLTARGGGSDETAMASGVLSIGLRVGRLSRRESAGAGRLAELGNCAQRLLMLI